MTVRVTTLFWSKRVGEICGIVVIGTAASWVQIWMYKACFPGQVELYPREKDAGALCRRTRSQPQDCASSLPPSLTHPYLWTPESTEEQYTVSVSTLLAFNQHLAP